MLEYPRVPSLTDLQQLYDRNCFLEAFQQSSEYWKPSTSLKELSPDELVFGGRLAFRLGGWRLSRKLFRAADARDPDNPRVRYFARHTRRGATKLVEDLRAFETNPDVCAADPEMHAAWLASYAVTFAFLRDFTRAHQCLQRAQDVHSEDGWITTCESDVLGLEDRWEEASEAAERAWATNPGAPHAARSLSSSLLNLSRVPEAARRLTIASENCQSYEVVHLACWYQCALAETLEGEERQCALRTASEFAERLPVLAPLADRDFRRLAARARLDVATLSDDHAEMERWADEVRIPFYRKMLANLRNNPHGRRLRLPFPRKIQKHQACLPTSIASALGTLGTQLNPDLMASEITFGGTTDWAAAEWLEKRGFAVRFFAVTREIATRLIENGIGFVLTLEGDDSAHAVAVVGVDEAAATLLIHDPSSYRGSEFLLEVLEKDREPLGWRGMAAVPAEKTSLLDQLLPADDVPLMTAAHLQQKALTLQGPHAARKIVDDIARKLPSHPGTRFLRAVQASEDGHTGEALLGLQQLYEEFGNSPSLRLRLIGACRSQGNTALMLQTLEGVVERGILPGSQSQQDWLFPPARYVAEYADTLGLSAATRPEAQSRLHGLLRRQPQSADGWHVLADLEWREHETEKSLLCYRIGSCLALSNDHYAIAYADALAKNHREEEGFSWLESRVQHFGSTLSTATPWICWIKCLEDWGHPDRALAVCKDALARQSESAQLLGFAVPSLARMGLWQEAEKHLGVLEKTGNAPLFREAAVEFYRLSGDLPRAIEHAEGWVLEVPGSMAARYALVNLSASRNGERCALELSARWLHENPGHEEMQELYYRQLERAGELRRKKYSLLLRRVKRNREDAWAWRELAFACIEDYKVATDRLRARLQPRIERWLQECDRTGRGDTATIRVHARWLEVCGLWKESLDLWLDSIDRDPENSYGYDRAWECSSRFATDERLEIWKKIEPLLLRCPGHLSIARTTLPLVAQRFGTAAAEEAVSRWRQLRPDDPDISEAFADLLLEHGQGKTDAERVYEVLVPAVARYPYHLGLHMSLVNTCRKLGRLPEAEEALREIIRRHPDHSAARIQLAWVHEFRGQSEEARKLLEEAAAKDPQNRQINETLVQILIRHNSLERAKAMSREALERWPRDVNWRQRAIRLLLECGDQEGAVEAAREGIRVYPHGAYLWFLLANTLNEFRRFAQPGEIENCFRRSLELNCTLFDGADLLAIHLVEQKRYRNAEQIMQELEPKLYDPSPAQGRLAWIHRVQGQTREAREELGATVQQYPWYQWGWQVLMEWLAEDQAWDQARNLLGKVPEELRTIPQFRRQRLVVLEQAGLPVEELDAEWKELLHDFPEELALHLIRYDLLQKAKRFEEARSVLRAAAPSEQDDPYYLARLVETFAQEQKPDEAVAAAQGIFFAETEQSNWPADYAWEALKKAQYLDRAYNEARRSLEKQLRPTLRTFFILCSHALERAKTDKVIPQSWWSTFFPDPGAKELLSLLALADRTPWINGRYRAKALDRLNDIGHYRLVTRYWKKHKGEVESDVATWAETGRALASLKQRKEACNLLSSWRTRRGVSMWTVANYVGCLSLFRKSGLRERVASPGDALRDLPHDHCARYLVHVRAEACALLGDKEGLQDTWKRYRNYFDCKENTGEWFQQGRHYLLTDIPMLVHYLQQNETGLYRRAVWGLRWNALLKSSGIRSGLQSNVSSAVPIPWWLIWLLIWIAIQVFRNS